MTIIYCYVYFQHTSQEHLTVRMYNCYFCQLKFLNRDDLFDHFKKFHNTLKSPLVCGLCKEKGNVQVQKDLQDHLLKFHPDDDFIQTFALAPLVSNSKPETIVEPKSKKQKLKPGNIHRYLIEEDAMVTYPQNFKFY